MKLAIVGCSRLSFSEESIIASVVKQQIEKYQQEYEHLEVISGGAKGVDDIAKEVALSLRVSVGLHFPKGNKEEDYLRRNRIIAKECDRLICISVNVHTKKCYHHDPPQDHEKTAGCYTMNKAQELNKPCRFFKV